MWALAPKIRQKPSRHQTRLRAGFLFSARACVGPLRARQAAASSSLISWYFSHARSETRTSSCQAALAAYRAALAASTTSSVTSPFLCAMTIAAICTRFSTYLSSSSRCRIDLNVHNLTDRRCFIAANAAGAYVGKSLSAVVNLHTNECTAGMHISRRYFVRRGGCTTVVIRCSHGRVLALGSRRSYEKS